MVLHISKLFRSRICKYKYPISQLRQYLAETNNPVAEMYNVEYQVNSCKLY